MRYSCKASVEYDLKLHYQLKEKYQAELNARSEYQGFRIKTIRSDRSTTFYSVKPPDSSKYLYAGKGDGLNIRMIREYAYMEKALAAIESNIFALEEFLKVYRITNAESINELLGRAYRLPRNDRLLLSEPEVEMWLRDKTAEKDKYPVYDPASLIATAFDGTKMRSRAETAHYETFYIYNIPCVYEFPYRIGNEIYRPDFTTLHVFSMNQSIWEHLGNWYHSNLHKREQYRAESINRFDEYARIGYYPEVNLHLTFGMPDNKFDVQAIHRKIAAYSMPQPSMDTIDLLKRF